MKIRTRMSELGIVLVSIVLACTMAGPARAGFEFQIAKHAKGEIGFWTQAWYQYVEDGKDSDGDGLGDRALHDFMVRRAYLNVKGSVTQYVDFFTHIAADRIGQDGLDRPSVGLGSGVAFRDIWVTLRIHEAFNIQVGRMYIPLTRNYGTTSTKALLTNDLPFLQGGVRGNIFYAGKVGRDDGVVLWGNPLDGRLQYRLMVSEGVEGDANPDDALRFAGRLALNLLEPEKGWFHKGTYLGEKKVLSLGFGLDTQHGLTLGGREDQDNWVWTADLFFDHPVGGGAVTAEAAYIHIQNCTQTTNFSNLAADDDGEDWFVQTGYLLPWRIGPGRVQPYVRYEGVLVEAKPNTSYWSGGLNYFIKGHNAKISADYTYVDQEEATPARDNHSIATFQITVGF